MKNWLIYIVLFVCIFSVSCNGQGIQEANENALSSSANEILEDIDKGYIIQDDYLVNALTRLKNKDFRNSYGDMDYITTYLLDEENTILSEENIEYRIKSMIDACNNISLEGQD